MCLTSRRKKVSDFKGVSFQILTREHVSDNLIMADLMLGIARMTASLAVLLLMITLDEEIKMSG